MELPWLKSICFVFEYFREDDFIKPQEGLEYNDDEDDVCDISSNVLSITEKKRNASRTEFSSQVSQFHAPVDSKVELFELVKGLGKKAQHSTLKKQISRVEKREKVLDVPLPRHQLEQITRVVQYEKTTKDVSIWEPVIQQNRKAEQLKFPLSQPDLKMHQTISQFVHQQHKPRTALELEVDAMLKLDQPIVDAVTRPLSKVEEDALKAMSLQEAQLKRAELQRNRMREAFVAAKMRQQGKIKSKKFHKIKRRARERQEKKQQEQMPSADTEAYQDWVKKAERQRIQERMSLRHKGTSRFMQRQTRFGKYNMVNRQAVQDMLQQGQTLRSKADTGDDVDDQGGLTSSDESDAEVDHGNPSDNQLKAAARDDLDQDAESDIGEDERIVETLTRKRTLEDLENVNDESMPDETADSDDGFEQISANKRRRLEDTKAQPKKSVVKRKSNVMIDPAQFMAVERDLSSASGIDLVTSGADDFEGSGFKVAMAFAEDDDVVAEFVSEKKSIIERDRPKDIDLRLPGWGDWSGPGIVASKRRKKRFVIKAPPAPPRKDRELGNVIISEAKDTSIAKHQVNSLPFPYTNVVDFEKRIRQPVGRTWNSVATYKKLVKPKVVTRLGQVIPPIDKSETFKKAAFDVKPADAKSKGKSRKQSFDDASKNGANRKRPTKMNGTSGERARNVSKQRK